MQRSAFYVVPLLIALALAACSRVDTVGTTKASGDPIAGRQAFLTTCATCHGADAKGIPGLGTDLTTSEYLRSQSDEQMLAFLLTGRPASDPLNRTGVEMPPKGNNPVFTDDDLKDIIAYLRTIQS